MRLPEQHVVNAWGVAAEEQGLLLVSCVNVGLSSCQRFGVLEEVKHGDLLLLVAEPAHPARTHVLQAQSLHGRPHGVLVDEAGNSAEVLLLRVLLYAVVDGFEERGVPAAATHVHYSAAPLGDADAAAGQEVVLRL